MAKLGDLIVRVGVDTRGLNDKLGNVKKQMRQTTGQLTQMGKSLSMSLTAPLLGIGALAVKAATDFEFSMAKVQAVSGFTAAEMGRLETQAQELGASTSKSASDVGQLQLELAKLGKTSTEIEQMTEGVLSLSIAFDTELGETARVVGATLNQFGLDASESGRIVDNMATLFGSSALDLEKFDTAMRTVGPTASAMGLSVEEAGAALGILVNSGVDASTAGTALTKSLVTLAQEGMTGKEAIEGADKWKPKRCTSL
jgi:TP901 family phage tail tape measure protein